MSNANSHHPPNIITCFSKQLSHIIADDLTDLNAGNGRQPLKDRIAVKLMLTLSEKSLYRSELLFRDYSQTPADLWLDYVLPNGSIQKLHTESIYYVQAVLGKRLTIVSKHKSFPTNLHILLLMLCRYSTDNNWLRTRVKRKREQMACINDVFFHKVAEILKRQCLQLKNISAVSKTYREQYGILYLVTGQNRVEVAEEISLFDVLEAVPAPLNPAIRQPPAWYMPLLERVLLSLNENYGLLRSCGLPPQEWGEELSIGKLRELKKLKKLAENYLKAAGQKTLYAAYQQAFSDLHADKDKVAGFMDFQDFAYSKVGVTLLKIEFVSLFPDDEEHENPMEKIAATEYSSVEMENGLERLLIDHAHSFSPLIGYFFKQAVILQRPLFGETGLLQDQHLLALISAHPDYALLDPEQLADKLIQKTKSFIKKHSHFDDPAKWLED